MENTLKINLEKKPKVIYLARTTFSENTHHEYSMTNSWGLHFYRGEGVMTINGIEKLTHDGLISFTPPIVSSVYDIDSSFDYYCAHIENVPPQVSDRKDNIFEFPFYVNSFFGSGEIAAQFMEAIILFKNQPERATLKIWDILWHIYYRIQNQISDNNLNPFIERATAIIHERLQNIVFPGEIADELGVSLTHLNRLFNRSKGTSLGKYLIYCKLDRVLDQLKTTNKSIKLISYEAGFNDLQHFNKVCHRHFGVAPSKLREMSLKLNIEDNFSNKSKTNKD